MGKKILSSYLQNKSGLDDDYRLFEDGSIERTYDRSTAPGNFNIQQIIKIEDLKYEIKLKLFENALENDKIKVRQLLNI
ncbi:hypothetical protein MM239_12265 [Belliella sp. DSM 111904]|uniref:Uncharacterized protein n=1 Tax=Belliella filtrata TaxID=2923435 RepID=A0ABS9V1F5_9BACT|nr:hypothetical protein [Belliella filtrata]MCH7410173.1 hypothetical protein [Belliella filtrata]